MVEDPGGSSAAGLMRPSGLRWGSEPPHEARYYVCRSCSRSEHGSFVPAGWYTVHRALGGNVKQRRLGLYCSLACLMKAHRQLQAGAAEHADFLGLPADDRAVLDSLFEEAHRYVVGDGLSLRDTGNLLGVPTGVLRDWFRSAGISVGEAVSSPTTEQPAPETIASFLAANQHPSAVGAIEELKDAKHLTDLGWAYSSTGPAHRPTFTCTATVVTAAGERIVLRAQGSKKPTAKNTAAEQLIARLLAGPDPAPDNAESLEAADGHIV
ncbi:double-stranded RNA binding motif domain-containing protein [Amycolatopsis sp. VS8301801F10]|uniref:double-stranded RNA binding motif domain-containing protein n=1 Tax=Amycolatopsis sp. VS8301801F10 TaxID=2652442 RepID=UPI0038FC4960